MKNEVKDLMLSLLESKGEVSAAEFREAMPGLPEQTVFSRIRALERNGLVFQSGRGKYMLGNKPEYRTNVLPRMQELCKLLTMEFVGATLCLSSSAKRNNILVETDRSEADRMLAFLRSKQTGVYSFKEAVPRIVNLRNAIIIKPIITNAPVVVSSGMTVPSLEKILVDLVADKTFFQMDEAALRKEYQRAFEVYPVNKNRVLRYAGRRSVKEEVEILISDVDGERVNTISTIQRSLAKQPVLRAWLFGSWSRMEENTESDIDLLVDFDKNAHVSLFDHIGFQQELESVLNKSVDYVTNGTLLPFAERSANIDKYLIYERRA